MQWNFMCTFQPVIDFDETWYSDLCVQFVFFFLTPLSISFTLQLDIFVQLLEHIQYISDLK